ncbi:MAG: serine hydrolase [Eubacterium sp.]|nr:serine hydrolase [Eubacterium sp.]
MLKKKFACILIILMLCVSQIYIYAEDEVQPEPSLGNGQELQEEASPLNEQEAEVTESNTSGETPAEAEPKQETKTEAETEDDGKVKLEKNGKPVLKSGSAIIYCKNTGEIVFSKSEEKKFAPYSITKLMTALLAAQKLSLDDKLTISAAAAAASNKEKGIELKEGEILTAEQLLYATLVMSDNGAAYALGEAISGTMPEFINLMNETAKNIGCNNTLFATPNGLIDDVAAEHTTASDLLEISKVAFSNKTVLKICGTLKYEIPKTEMSKARKMENSNKLLAKKNSGYISGKVGYWSDNKTTITMAYKKNGLELIMVVLGSGKNTRYTLCEKMVDYAISSIKGISVVSKGEILGKARVKHGVKTRVDVESATEAMAYLPAQGSKDLIRTETVIKSDIEAPVKKGDVMGSYRIYVSDELVNEVELISVESVGIGWFPSYIGISNRATVFILIGVSLVVLLLFVRLINKARTRRLKKRLRKEQIRQKAMEELMREHEQIYRYKRR